MSSQQYWDIRVHPNPTDKGEGLSVQCFSDSWKLAPLSLYSSYYEIFRVGFSKQPQCFQLIGILPTIDAYLTGSFYSPPSKWIRSLASIVSPGALREPPGRGSSLMFWGPIRDKPDVISSPSFSGLSSTFKCWSNCS